MRFTLLTLALLGWFDRLREVRPERPEKPVQQQVVVPAPVPRPSYELRIDGDRMTLRADETPLKDILAGLVRAGVKVQFDPAIESRISGLAEDEPVDEVLEKILQPYGYVITWSVIPGPLGNIERLDEVQVFRREGPRALEPFMPEENFRVTRGSSPDGPEFIADEILIAFKPGTSIDQFRVLLAQIGGSVIDSAPGLGIYRIRLPANTNIPALVAALENNGIVSRVEPNYAYRRKPEITVASPPDAPSSQGARLAQEGVPKVAVLDSGLLPLSALEGLVAGTYDAILPSRLIDDRKGHGTQMALIASGAVPPGGTEGDTTGVPVLAIRAFDDNGYTSNFTLMRAMDYAAEQGARVINLSWGSDVSSSFLNTAVQEAQERGMVVVAAAGNEPTGAPVYPAAYSGVISVSALRSDGEPWEQSNFGGSVDLAAPGTAMLPVGFEGTAGSYAGTSIATAYVSRNLALYLAAHPESTVAEAKRALLAAVTPLSSADARYGQGSLDAEALERLLKAP